MATLVLSAIGASLGASVGGSVIGLSSIVIGKAIGATVGSLIDQRVMGGGSEAVATGRIDRFRLSGASEGDAIPKSFGRVRVGGQVIWASRFKEEVAVAVTGGSGKGGGRKSSSSYSYSVSLALALGEGVVTRIGRIWADGVQVSKEDYNLRFYPGDELQLPDAKIAAVEGADNAPAFRGTAYVVFEDLDLGPFGNRVPQFSFEVFRKAQPAGGVGDASAGIRGVALIPGSGEYALATTPVHFEDGLGVNRSINVNSASGKSDLETSLDSLREELPLAKSVSLVVSWFGDDLRCDRATLTPRVEQNQQDAVGMAWQVSGQNRSAATVVSQVDDRPVFGGTPADQSVIEAITAIRAGGQEVMFYPFILMDVQAGNTLTDPWSGGASQSIMPWRGRMTLSLAPGQGGSPDKSALADSEVAAFFGTAQASDFSAVVGSVIYSGPSEWSYRRFVLHYAQLCALAGGVEAFCIGSELRGLTQIRGAGDVFPVVAGLKALAADVRSILGSDCKIGYAADWSEYFGHQPPDGSGDVLFHLDPLWADANVDFIGIDNYMPVADWRDGAEHVDATYGSIYALEYLKANIAGGEGFDWYYENANARDRQIRSPISDGAYGEDWIYRYKDLKGWWSSPHYDRLGGVKQVTATAWVPGSKPIWFTELGCAAIDKGANQPNVFLDPKSSESAKPYYSNGLRDDFMQSQYLRAVFEFWEDAGNNPVSELYLAPMVDMEHAHVWAWDARPWPEFPANLALWSDGNNYARGHWLNGRIAAQGLAEVVAEICEVSGVFAYDVSQLYGAVTGYSVSDLQSGRAMLQPLMLIFGFDAIERDGVLFYQPRGGQSTALLDADRLVWTGEEAHVLQATRAPEAEMAGQVRLSYIRADGSYEAGAAEAVMPDVPAAGVSRSEVSLVISKAEADGVVARWLAESRLAQESVSFALPPSMMGLGAGDIVTLPPQYGAGTVRIDRIEDVGFRRAEAVLVERSIYDRLELAVDDSTQTSFVAPVPVFPVFLDLPLLRGNEVEHAPHIAVTATPWPGSVAVYSAPSDEGYVLNRLLERSAVIGVMQTGLAAAAPSRWDNGPGVEVKVFGGILSSATLDGVLNGANVMAIGDGSSANWEVLQFSDATLIAENTYVLSSLLRGQAGTEAVMPEIWPPGSLVVLLNEVPTQIELATGARNLARYYRVGPAQRPYSDASYRHEIEAFSGIGLRPYAPAHLGAVSNLSGDLDLTWMRRTRIDGDGWENADVPLGEAFEAYNVQVMQSGTLVRETITAVPNLTYAAGLIATDGLVGSYTIQVAQISERFGAGSYSGIIING